MRRFFPSLKKYNNHIFCDNAGGSQIPSQVIESFSKFVSTKYIQPGSNNYVSKKLTSELKEIDSITSTILNNKIGKNIYGTSCTQLAYNLANSLENHLVKKKGNIILPNFTHESCVNPFEKIANKNNIELKWWNVDKKTYAMDYETLLKQVNKDTSLVVLPHVSNILGNIVDVKYLNSEIKKINPNVQTLVDGVAYLPHGAVDFDSYDVDYYIVSFYKFCGLRISALAVKDYKYVNSIMENQNHYFYDNVSDDSIGTKLELGGISFELASSITGLKDYFIDYAKQLNYDNHEFNRTLVEFVMHNIRDYEQSLTYLMQKCLINNPEVKVIESSTENKAPIFSLKFNNFNNRNVNLILNELGLICKTSTYHCDRLFDHLELDKKEGLLRISLMHFNSLKEVHDIVDFINLFQKKTHKFNFLVDNGEKKDLSLVMKESFDKLSKDKFYANDRLRAYSLLNITNENDYKIMGDVSFYQTSNYNNYNGNLLRNYNNIDNSLLYDKSFKFMVKLFKETIYKETKELINYMQIHQIRVYGEELSTNIIPEGIHQDGFNIVGIYCVSRKNIIGGINNIYDEQKDFVYAKQLEEGEMIVINDRKMYHDVSNVQLYDNDGGGGYRDVFILTTIA